METGQSRWPILGRDQSAELRLLLRCLAYLPGRTDAYLEAICDAARKIEAWPSFIALVRRHRVGGLVQRSIGDTGLALLPAPAAAMLRSLGHDTIRRSLLHQVELGRIDAVCRQQAIAYAALKGVGLSQRLYGNSALRHSKDIDLWTAPDEIDRLSAALITLGYRPDQRVADLGPHAYRVWRHTYKEFSLFNERNGVEIELHWRPADNPHLLDLTFDPDRLDFCAVAPNLSLPVLKVEDEFAYLCVHGSVDAWFRLKWLADIYAIVAGLPAERIIALLRHAEGLGAGIPATHALVHCERFLGISVPRRNPVRAPAPLRMRLLGAVVRCNVLREDGRDRTTIPFATLGPALSRMLLGRGCHYWARQLRRFLWDPSEFIDFRLPDELVPLLPLLRPVLWLLKQARIGRAVASTPVRMHRQGADS